VRGVSDRPSRSDDLDPEGSGRFDDQAHDDPLSPDRIAAELRRAADAFHPDDERIRQIINARGGERGPLRPTAPVTFPGLSARRRLLWPVAGSAAAAAVILSVFARGPLPVPEGVSEDPGSMSSSDSVAVGVTQTSTVRSSASPPPSTAGVGSGSTAPSRDRADGRRQASPSSGLPHPSQASSPPGEVAQRSHAPAAPTAPAGGPSVTRMSRGGHDLTVSVRPVEQGSTANVGHVTSEEWLAASGTSASSQALSTGSGSELGPVQALGSGYATIAGPFTVLRPDRGSGAQVTTTSWITAPGFSGGASSGLRIPVRYQRLPAVVTLFVGTTAGGGRITVTMNASAGGTSPVELPVTLPGCPQGTCPSVVTVTIGQAAGASPPSASGDIIVDLRALTPAARVGFAAASLR
jgi:hypothetical protein